MTIPTADQIDASWLTDCLRAAGHDRVRVRGFDATRIGTGQIGKCIRYTLDYASASDGAPRTLVGKFPSDDPISRQTGVDLGNYRREVEFYRQLASRLTIRTPRCYYAAVEGVGPHFALLLSDAAPAVPGDQLAGCNEAVARAAVLELAGLHAPTWNDPTICGVEWISEPSADTIDRTVAGTSRSCPASSIATRTASSADSRAIIERVASSTGHPFNGSARSLRADPCRLPARQPADRRAASPPTVTVVDWQSVTVGQPLSDVAYFLGAGSCPRRGAAAKSASCASITAVCSTPGSRGYSWADCWQDYRRGAFAGFLVTVIASMLVQETARGNEMFIAMAQRHSRHAIDLGAAEFLCADAARHCCETKRRCNG